jgi:hypothetical protein
MKLGFWKLKLTAGIGNTSSQPNLDISPIWIPLISTEVTNSHRSVWCDRFCKILVSRVQFYSTDGTSGRQKMVSQHSPFNPTHWFSWTWGFLHKIFISLSILISCLYMFYHIFIAYFPVISLRQSLVSSSYVALVILTWIVQWLRLVLSKGPKRVGILIWGRKQIWFPKRCVLYFFLEYRTMDKVQEPCKCECHTPLSERFRIS